MFQNIFKFRTTRKGRLAGRRFVHQRNSSGIPDSSVRARVCQLVRGLSFWTKAMTDADTIANADDLWRLVELVQDRIDKDGCVHATYPDPQLAEIRKLADTIKPEN